MPVSPSVLPTAALPATDGRLPVVIQGGMGVAVSSWQLARAVSQAGQLGVVSGTALDVVIARRLQDGDTGGHVRRALESFPVPAMAQRILSRYFLDGGRAPKQPYHPVPKLSMDTPVAGLELSMVANFAEVWLAKEGHDGLVGINFLEKVQMATPSAAYGAMLAGVDYVLMWAGIPSEIPRLLNHLARHEQCSLDLHVDGFVVEGPRAGGHNAPPRGRLVLDDDGQPVFGPRDDADLAKVAAVGLPFWLAGGYSTAVQVKQALAEGAAGVQVGTLFALCEESGIETAVRKEMLSELAAGRLEVRTDALASPTGFPFKVASLPGSLSEPETYAARPRLCDLSYLLVGHAKVA